MVARSRHEPHRVATPLELLFDLVFVVAIAQAAEGLHHAIVEHHTLVGLEGFLMVFFAIWWAWMNFTWFASAYDIDDVPYRLAVFVQIAGALVLAGGVTAMLEARVPNVAVLGGYVLMRLALVAQWLRAAASDPPRRVMAYRYAAGITLTQAAWLAMLWMPQYWHAGFAVLVSLELAVAVFAERAAGSPWHPHHIAERYGLLTLIVLGESILAGTLAVQSALVSGQALGDLIALIAGGLLLVFSMWWVYFDRPVHDLLTSVRTAIEWGYGHYVVFASAAAVGAGLAVSVDQVTARTGIGRTTAGYAVAIPAALFLVSLWLLHRRRADWRTGAVDPVVAVLILLTPLTGHAVLLSGVLLASMVGARLVVSGGAAADHSASGGTV